jgi:hypothetical protein
MPQKLQYLPSLFELTQTAASFTARWQSLGSVERRRVRTFRCAQRVQAAQLLSRDKQEGPDDGASTRPQPLSPAAATNCPAGQSLLVVGLRCPTHRLLLQRRCLMGQMLVNDAVQRAARSAMRHGEHKCAAAQFWLSSSLCGCADLSAAPLVFPPRTALLHLASPSPRNVDRASARAQAAPARVRPRRLHHTRLCNTGGVSRLAQGRLLTKFFQKLRGGGKRQNFEESCGGSSSKSEFISKFWIS